MRSIMRRLENRGHLGAWAHRFGSQKAPHRSGSNVGDSDWASIVGLASSWYQHRDIVLMSPWVRHRFGRTLLWQLFGIGAVEHGLLTGVATCAGPHRARALPPLPDRPGPLMGPPTTCGTRL